MLIHIDETPNPLCLKFIPGITLLDPGVVYTFEKNTPCSECPLAENLFAIDQVDSVFIGYDFVSVTKTQEGDWAYLRPMIIATLRDYFSTGASVITPLSASMAPNPSENTESDDPIIRQIKDIIETKVRPAVAQDGGDITFERFENGIVYLRLQGACSGCPSSSATLKSGIENMLRYYVPEVLEVQAA